LNKAGLRWFHTAELLLKLRADINRESGSEGFWQALENGVNQRNQQVQQRLREIRSNQPQNPGNYITKFRQTFLRFRIL